VNQFNYTVKNNEILDSKVPKIAELLMSLKIDKTGKGILSLFF